MKDLIEALQIFSKYTDTKYPTHCEHDVLYIMDVDFPDVSEEDVKRLYELGFIWGGTDNGEECFMSFRFGSA